MIGRFDEGGTCEEYRAEARRCLKMAGIQHEMIALHPAYSVVYIYQRNHQIENARRYVHFARAAKAEGGPLMGDAMRLAYWRWIAREDNALGQAARRLVRIHDAWTKANEAPDTLRTGCEPKGDQ